MEISKTVSVSLVLDQLEAIQLLDAARYLRHRANKHPDCGLSHTSCQPGFINKLVSGLEDLLIATPGID